MFTDVLIDADPFDGIDVSHLADPPDSLLEHNLRVPRQHATATERREFPRYAVDAVALVRPVDTSFRPTGPAFRAVVADISAVGLRLLHTRFVGAHLLAVRLDMPPAQSVTVAMTVLRSEPRRGCYEVAGQILARLDGDREFE